MHKFTQELIYREVNLYVRNAANGRFSRIVNITRSIYMYI